MLACLIKQDMQSMVSLRQWNGMFFNLEYYRLFPVLTMQWWQTCCLCFCRKHYYFLSLFCTLKERKFCVLWKKEKLSLRLITLTLEYWELFNWILKFYHYHCLMNKCWPSFHCQLQEQYFSYFTNSLLFLQESFLPLRFYVFLLLYSFSIAFLLFSFHPFNNSMVNLCQSWELNSRNLSFIFELYNLILSCINHIN